MCRLLWSPGLLLGCEGGKGEGQSPAPLGMLAECLSHLTKFLQLVRQQIQKAKPGLSDFKLGCSPWFQGWEDT